MGSRHPNPRLAKIHRSYSVEEMARLFNVHKNTIRSWFKQGLEVIDRQRPTVARGEEIRRFLAEPPGAREASLRAGPYLLPAVPRAEGSRREDGRIRGDQRHHRDASWHLSRLRPDDLPHGQPAEDRGRARRPGRHGHTSGSTHRRDNSIVG
jgi:hypothetical protein